MDREDNRPRKDDAEQNPGRHKNEERGRLDSLLDAGSGSSK